MTITFPPVTLCLAGCTSRSGTPIHTADSTMVYPGKDPRDVTATITFCQRYDRESGKRIGVGREFMIDEGERVWAVVDLENLPAPGSRPLSFHLVWLWPDGSTLYKKNIEYVPGRDDPVFDSNISISPERRDPGRYTFQVYLFRELIAQKSFELL